MAPRSQPTAKPITPQQNGPGTKPPSPAPGPRTPANQQAGQEHIHHGPPDAVRPRPAGNQPEREADRQRSVRRVKGGPLHLLRVAPEALRPALHPLAQRRPADPPPRPGCLALLPGSRVTGPAAGPPDGDGGRRQLTYDVRIWKTRIIKGAFGRAYQARWIVAGKVRYATFANKALADSHEAKIRTAAREGEPFDTSTGLPLSMATQKQDQ